MTELFAHLLDWRREIAELYGRIRATDEPRIAWQDWRQTRDRLFRNHPQSPLEPDARKDFVGLRYYDYDPAWRFTVSLAPAKEDKPDLVDAGADGAVSLTPFASTRGLSRQLGADLTLYWINGYGGGAFLPFCDATAGRETFAGGRYLFDTIKGADLGGLMDGQFVLDFNFAYNPSCAYSARWTCPLAPLANSLPRPVNAGEKLPPPD